MEDREERSKGIEIRIADAFAIIKPTAPFKFAKHESFLFIIRGKVRVKDNTDTWVSV